MKTKADPLAPPTLQVLRSQDRGHANHGWLDTYHSFSFGNYYNPAQMGFRSLRVINQDIIDPGAGFPTHPHSNMAIFTYMLSGTLNHRDSMGNQGSIQPGEIQLMSAGSGITHSEFNGSHNQPASLLQIWITPAREDLTPSYTDWTPSRQQREAKKALLISPDGQNQSATIHQDAYIYRLKLQSGDKITHTLSKNRGAWIQLIHGELTANNVRLQSGDAAFTEESGEISLLAHEDAEALLFDLN